MNVAELTCKEVNRALAERRGEIFDGHMFHPGQDEAAYQQHGEHWIQDYCHDWRWAGVLLEEVTANGWRLRYLEDAPEGCDSWQIYEPPMPEDAPTVIVGSMIATDAVSRARLEMYLGAESP